MIYNDHFQNFKTYNLHKAQLIIADIPYNIGKNAYGSNPKWYIDGDNKHGESELAGKEIFDTDKNFKPAEFIHFCSKLLKKEPKEKGQAPCMIVFCAFEQQMYLIELAKRYGLNNYLTLFLFLDIFFPLLALVYHISTWGTTFSLLSLFFPLTSSSILSFWLLVSTFKSLTSFFR